MASAYAICVDFGSTYTKAALVDLESGELLALADHPTTIETDVMEGLAACRAELEESHPEAFAADGSASQNSAIEVLACSSAGGGLRIAVMGNEDLVTAEAGRRVALSSGGKVVAVWALSLGLPGRAEIEEAAPDVVLLTGGTDGGNSAALLTCAQHLADSASGLPVVIAGNAEAQGRARDILSDAGFPCMLAENVLPKIGVLEPESARSAVRELFLSHVIGGKHLSASDEFLEMVKGPTPDLVLTGVEVLARGLDPAHPGAGDVAVVDVGGATTDVHSVVELDPEDAGLSREVVATTPVTRTVEGDLGMRWSAVTTVATLGLPESDPLVAAAAKRTAQPSYLPADAAEEAEDEAIASAAVGEALRRHAGRSKVVVSPEGRVVERSGKDLREVDLLIGSGGVLRHGASGIATRVLTPHTGDGVEAGWQLPREPRVIVDRTYVLAAAGLLADRHPQAAYKLAKSITLL